MIVCGPAEFSLTEHIPLEFKVAGRNRVSRDQHAEAGWRGTAIKCVVRWLCGDAQTCLG